MERLKMESSGCVNSCHVTQSQSAPAPARHKFCPQRSSSRRTAETRGTSQWLCVPPVSLERRHLSSQTHSLCRHDCYHWRCPASRLWTGLRHLQAAAADTSRHQHRRRAISFHWPASCHCTAARPATDCEHLKLHRHRTSSDELHYSIISIGSKVQLFCVFIARQHTACTLRRPNRDTVIAVPSVCLSVCPSARHELFCQKIAPIVKQLTPKVLVKRDTKWRCMGK